MNALVKYLAVGVVGGVIVALCGMVLFKLAA